MVALSGWFPAHALLVLLVVAVLAAHAAPSGERELQEDGLALTPFGYWPAACVHAAPNGTHPLPPWLQIFSPTRLRSNLLESNLDCMHTGAHVETTAKGLVRIVHPDGSEHHHQPCASRYSPSRLQGSLFHFARHARESMGGPF
jgi:hypothetical protein